jgi:putative ABC transport system permease protein
MPLIWRANLNHLRRHPWQTGLAIFGIMLGVAIVVAVQATQHSANEAFRDAQRGLSGTATHRIEATDGIVDETFYARLVQRFPDLDAQPILTGEVELARRGEWLKLVGVDLLNSLGMRSNSATDSRAVTLLTKTQGLVSRDTFDRLLQRERAAVTILTNEHAIELPLTTFPAHAGPEPVLLDNVVLMDIATAQELLGRTGQLSHIDLCVSKPSSQTLAALRAFLPPHLHLHDLANVFSEQQLLSKAFDTNLTALSLLGLLVGMFLVYNTESFLVLQRHLLFRRLRELGVTSSELLLGIAIEALVIGVIASALGVILGIVLSNVLLDLATRTRRDFYDAVATQDLSLSATMLGLCFAGGIAATLAAALPPGLGAARAPLRESLYLSAARSTRADLIVRSLASVSLALLGLGGLLPLSPLWRDFAMLFLVLAVVAIWLPFCLTGLALPVQHTLRKLRLWPEQLGIAISLHSRRRVDPATVALCLAAAVSLGMQLMTSSFRQAVDDWLTRLLRADFYVTATDATPRDIVEQRLSIVAKRLSQVSGIAAVGTVTRLAIDAEDHRTALAVYELPIQARAGYQFIAGDPDRIWAAWETRDTLIVTEPYARHHRHRRGDSVVLATPDGPRSFQITGIYRDYSNERGNLAISRQTFRRYWPEHGYHGLSVYLDGGSDSGAVSRALNAVSAASPGIEIHPNADLRRRALTIFDRTFRITQLLALLTLVVSVVGMVGALLAQQIERAQDYGVLRALGFVPLELARVVVAQTLLIGGVAATLAIPIGIGIASFLVQVINVHAFGWTMPLHISSSMLCTSWISVLIAAASAAVYPVLRITRISPAQALRDE